MRPVAGDYQGKADWCLESSLGEGDKKRKGKGCCEFSVEHKKGVGKSSSDTRVASA